jgi:hypothetical protein
MKIELRRLQQEHLGRPPGRFHQSQPGGQHPGLVDHEDIARLQIAGQVGNGGVVHTGPTRHRSVHQHARCTPGLDW